VFPPVVTLLPPLVVATVVAVVWPPDVVLTVVVGSFWLPLPVDGVGQSSKTADVSPDNLYGLGRSQPYAAVNADAAAIITPLLITVPFSIGYPSFGVV
jgi:hypothetical protein